LASQASAMRAIERQEEPPQLRHKGRPAEGRKILPPPRLDQPATT
jgi:hypothetical protein